MRLRWRRSWWMMGLWLAVLLGAPALPWAAWTVAHSGDQPPVVNVTPEPMWLGPAMQWLAQEPGASLAPPLQASGWQAVGSKDINWSFSSRTYWLRIALHNPGTERIERVLDLSSATADEIEIDVYGSQGQLLERVVLGDRFDFSLRKVALRTLTHKLTFEPGQTNTLYVRQTPTDFYLDALRPRLLSANDLAGAVQMETLLIAPCLGMLGALLFYNLVLFISTRDAPFGWLVAYIFSMLCWSLIDTGYAQQYIFPMTPDWHHRISILVMPMMVFTALGYIFSYLDAGHHLRKYKKLLHVIVATCLLGVIFALLGHFALTAVASMIGASLILPLAAFAGVRQWRIDPQGVQYFLAANAVMCVCALGFMAQVMAWAPPHFLSDNLLLVGAALEALLLSIGLADRMRRVEAQALRAEREAGRLQLHHAQQLEAQVAQRTQALQQANRALEEANAQLEMMAVTDELTRTHNRRRFNEDLEGALARHAGQGGGALGLVLIDIDHFKAYNDHYGHDAGDQTLRRVAQTLARHLQRRNDHIYRVGGEEFALLLAAHDEGMASAAYVEHLCRTVQALALPHAGSPLGVVTLSAGLVFVAARSPTPAGQVLYSQADAQLYAAKAAGRNTMRWCMADGAEVSAR